jgi:hypothetical protein
MFAFREFNNPEHIPGLLVMVSTCSHSGGNICQTLGFDAAGVKMLAFRGSNNSAS